jgi:hypothetical protein
MPDKLLAWLRAPTGFLSLEIVIAKGKWNLP